MTTYAETFNTADSDTLGPVLTWQKFSGDDDPYGAGPNDGHVVGNAFGVDGGDRTGQNQALYTDSFNRANSAVTMGSTDGGFESPEPWSTASGTWGISSNQAYSVTSTAHGRAYVAFIGEDRVEIEVTLVAGTDVGLAWKDSWNGLDFWYSNKAGQIRKVVAGVHSTAFTLTTGALNDGDTLTIRMTSGSGSFDGVYECFVNGVAAGTFTDTHNQFEESYGLYANSSSNGRFENFTIRSYFSDVGGFARAEHDVGSTNVYTQAEITALDVSDPNYPYFLVGASLDTSVAFVAADAYNGPSGVWAAIQPNYNAPDNTGIGVYIYDQPSHTYSLLTWDTAPGGAFEGDEWATFAPNLVGGELIRIDHDATNRYVEVSIDGTVYWTGSYTLDENPVAAFGQRGGIGVLGFSSPDQYTGDGDLLDNFETGITSVTGSPPPAPTIFNQLLARHYADGQYPDGTSTDLDDALQIGFTDPLRELGGASVVLRYDDAAGDAIEPDDVIVISVVGFSGVPGVDAVAFIVDDDDTIELDPDEEKSETRTFAGSLILGRFKDGLIEPPNGVDSLPVVDDVHFDYTHPAFDDSAWSFATQISDQYYARRFGPGPTDYATPGVDGRWGGTEVWGPIYPSSVGPDPDGSPTAIIGPSSGTIDDAPAGDNFFRATFTTWFTGPHLVFARADNAGSVFVDGAEVCAIGHVNGDRRNVGFHDYTFGQVDLTAGDTHTLALTTTNWPQIFVGAPNPTGISVSIWVPSWPVFADDLIFETSTAMTILEYPATTPGMSPCEMVSVWLDQHQADGRFTEWSLSCTDGNDSAGNAWAVKPTLSFRVGADDGLSMMLKAMEAYCDVRIVAGTTVIDMYNKDAFAPASGATFTRGVNLRALRFHTQRLAADELLVRSQFGWTRVGAAGGRRQGSFTFGPENAFDEVERLSTKELTLTDNDLEEVSFAYKPLADSQVPYVNTNFVPGSTASVPTKAGGSTTERCVQIQMGWQQDEDLAVAVSYKSLVLQEQERVLRAMKALGA